MVRQLLARTTPVGPKPLTALTAVTWTAGDATNKEEIVISEREIVILWNTHGSTSYTYTITAVADGLGRSVDIGPTALVAGAMVCFRPGLEGFGQPTTHKLYMEVNNAAIKYAVVNF